MCEEKEVFRLWREYLKESKYANFCERLRNYKGRGIPGWFKKDPFAFGFEYFRDIEIPFKDWWKWHSYRQKFNRLKQCVSTHTGNLILTFALIY